MIKGLILISFVLTTLVSCQTVPAKRLTKVPYSLGTIMKVVVSVIPGGIRKKSENGREVFSYYFSPVGEKNFNPETSLNRAYVHVLILGERRPYTIEVRVPIEEKSGYTYQIVDYDINFADRYFQQIKVRLREQTEDRNVIDDFRVF